MVKKSSVFDKIRNRMRSTQVRVDAPLPPEARARTRFDDPTDAVAPDGVPEFEHAVARPLAEAASSRRLSAREEANVALRDGFQELASLLRGMQARTDVHGEQIHQLAERLATLPELGAQQLRALEVLAERLETQGRAQERVFGSLGELPATLAGVREALERAARVDERTGATLTEFRAHMGRIQQSMEQMVDTARRQGETTRALADAPQQGLRAALDGQRELADRIEAAQAKQVESLRDAQADQAARLARLVEDGTRTNRAVVVLLALVVLGLLAVVGALTIG